MESPSPRRDLQTTVLKVVQAIRGDDLLKVMAKEQSTEQFSLQRVNQIVDYVYKADRQRFIQQLSSENDRLKNQLASLQASWNSLQEQNIRIRARLSQAETELTRDNEKMQESIIKRQIVLMQSCSQSQQHRLQREVYLLKQQLSAKEMIVAGLREGMKKDKFRIEEAKDAIKKLQSDLASQQQLRLKQIQAIKYDHRDEVLALKRVANRQIESTNDTYRKEKRFLTNQNDYALNALVRLHKDQLQRFKIQHQAQTKALVEQVQHMQKKCRQYEETISLVYKEIQAKTHPRILVDQMARFNGQLSLKESQIIMRDNANQSLRQQLQRVRQERSHLLQQLQQFRARSMDLNCRQQHSISAIQQQASTSLQKCECRLKTISQQINRVAQQSQKFENRCLVLENQCSVLGLENGLLKERALAGQARESQLAKTVQSLEQRLKQILGRNQTLQENLKTSESRIKRFTDTLKSTEKYDDLLNQISSVQKERSTIQQAYLILKTDFSELTRVYRDIHQTNKELQRQNFILKSDRQTLSLKSTRVNQSQDRVFSSLRNLETEARHLSFKYFKNQNDEIRIGTPKFSRSKANLTRSQNDMEALHKFSGQEYRLSNYGGSEHAQRRAIEELRNQIKKNKMQNSS